jgi:hypothetical protein
VRHDDAGYELTRVLDLDMQSGIPVGTGMNGAVLPFDFRTPPHVAARHAHEDGVIVELPPQRRHVVLVPRGSETGGELPGDLCAVHGDMLGHSCRERPPEIARALAARGAEAIVIPPRRAAGPFKEEHWVTLVRDRQRQHDQSQRAARLRPPARGGWSCGEAMAALGLARIRPAVPVGAGDGGNDQ